MLDLRQRIAQAKDDLATASGRRGTEEQFRYRRKVKCIPIVSLGALAVIQMAVLPGLLEVIEARPQDRSSKSGDHLTQLVPEARLARSRPAVDADPQPSSTPLGDGLGKLRNEKGPVGRCRRWNGLSPGRQGMSDRHHLLVQPHINHAVALRV